jgi:hypothetical protein
VVGWGDLLPRGREIPKDAPYPDEIIGYDEWGLPRDRRHLGAHRHPPPGAGGDRPQQALVRERPAKISAGNPGRGANAAERFGVARDLRTCCATRP